MYYIRHDHHHYSIYAGWLGALCRRLSRNGWQRCFPYEGRGPFCCIVLFAEAGCNESVTFGRFDKGRFRPHQEERARLTRFIRQQADQGSPAIQPEFGEGSLNRIDRAVSRMAIEGMFETVLRPEAEGAPQAEMPQLRWETILAVPCGPFRAHPNGKINPG
jgi:hypothetical protein